MLEDGPFRVVSHLGLADSDDYEAVRKCLQQRYAPEGNELDRLAASFAEAYAEGWRTAGRLCRRAAHAG